MKIKFLFAALCAMVGGLYLAGCSQPAEQTTEKDAPAGAAASGAQSTKGNK